MLRPPFRERGGALRGVVDLATGCYPSFLFGGSLGGALPVFHFHDVTREWLEPRKQYRLNAILFAIPGRVHDRPNIGADPNARPDDRFVTWEQLREMHTSGVWD